VDLGRFGGSLRGDGRRGVSSCWGNVLGKGRLLVNEIGFMCVKLTIYGY
jgi:hypothetical protein